MKRILAVLSVVVAILGFTTSVVLADRTSQEGVAYAATGGGLNTDDGYVRLYVPPGAYTSDLRIRYTPKTLAHFPGEHWTYTNFILIGKPFQLDIEIRDGGEGIEISKPAIITIPYNPDEFGGRSLAGLRLAGWDGGRTTWNPISTTVDPVRKVVIAEITEGGDFGLIIENVAPATAPEPAPIAAPEAPAPAPVPAIPMNSSITGKVFYDKDGNGTMDGEDFPIGGAGLKISSGDWSAMSTSQADGGYAFWSLRESAYSVEMVVGPEWEFTTPNVVSDIWVNGQGANGTAGFGMWYKLP